MSDINHDLVVQACLNEGIITTRSVVAAVRSVPLQPFVSAARMAARRIAVAVETGSAISELLRPLAVRVVDGRGHEQAATSVFCPLNTMVGLDHLQLREGMSVLEVGTGLGYSTALLTDAVGSCGNVESVEVDSVLRLQAISLLKELDLLQTAYCHAAVEDLSGDGFDRVIVWPATPTIRPEWLGYLQGRSCLLIVLIIEGVQFFVRLDQWRSGGRLSGGIVGRPYSAMPPIQPLSNPKLHCEQDFAWDRGLVPCRSTSITRLELFPFWLFCISEGIPAVLATPGGMTPNRGVMYVDGDRCAFVGIDGLYSVDGGADRSVAALQRAYDAWRANGRPGVFDYIIDIWPGAGKLSSKGADDLGPLRWRVGEVNRVGTWAYRVKRVDGKGL